MVRASVGESPEKADHRTKPNAAIERRDIFIHEKKNSSYYPEECAPFDMEDEIISEKDRPGSNLAYYCRGKRVTGARAQISLY